MKFKDLKDCTYFTRSKSTLRKDGIEHYIPNRSALDVDHAIMYDGSMVDAIYRLKGDNHISIRFKHDINDGSMRVDAQIHKNHDINLTLVRITRTIVQIFTPILDLIPNSQE